MIKTLIVLFALLLLPFASAEDIEITEAGTTPNSPFYFLDVLFDDLGVTLTFNDSDAIEKQFEIANERLAESYAMGLKGNVGAMEEASKQYEKTMAQIRERIELCDEEDRIQYQTRLENRLILQENTINDIRVGLQTRSQEMNLTSEKLDVLDTVICNMEKQCKKVNQ